MAASLDNLNIQISASTAKAVTSVNNLVKALENLKTALGQIDTKGLDECANAAGKLNNASVSMKDSVKPGQYHETLDGGWQEVYPQGNDPRGVSNTVKAFVINYGYGGKRTEKTGDKFITGNKRKRQEAVTAAMEAENKKILNEANGGT